MRSMKSARLDVVDVLEDVFGAEMLHQHVVESPGRPGRFLTSIADEYPSRQRLIQSRPLPKPIGFLRTIPQTPRRTQPAFRTAIKERARVPLIQEAVTPARRRIGQRLIRA